MANKFDITSENMRGHFSLIRVSDTDSGDIILFGMYRGGYEGRLVVPPQSILSTALVSEIHAQLIEKFPQSIWTVNFGQEPKTHEELMEFKELRDLFESVGIHAEDAGDKTEE